MSDDKQLKGKAYWRSLNDLAGTPEFKSFVEKEFPAHASEWFGASRRGFLKLMGASLALAGLTSCTRWPEDKIAEYAHRPVNRMPGAPVHYATAWEFQGVGQGLVVTSYDGRPTKIEGNPLHPLNKGATDAFAQATVLDMYDPERSRLVIKHDGGRPTETTWAEFDQAAAKITDTLKAKSGAGFYVLSEATSSPSVLAARANLLKAFPQAQWLEYEAISDDNQREGTRLAFGQPHRVVLALQHAETIVSFDADFLCGGDPVGVKYAREFADGRRVRAQAGEKPSEKIEMSRLYVIESLHTNTGVMADHRVALSASQIPAAVLQVAAKLGVPGVPAPSAEVLPKKLVEAMTRDLLHEKGESAVIAGLRMPKEVHAVVAAINAHLGNVGKTVQYYADPIPDRPSHLEAIKTLAADLKAGKVETLVILGGNPVYTAPGDLALADALKASKGVSIILSHEGKNETSELCTWHLPRAHYLEAWGDVRSFDGTISITQPLIEPLFGGKSPIELLAQLTGDSVRTGMDLVQRTQRGLSDGANTEWKWKKALFDGVVADSAWKPATPSLQGSIAGLDAIARTPAAKGELELVFFSDYSVFDGRWANNGWMQELPDPMTKMTWDNALLIAPGLAEKLGINVGDMLSIKANGVSQEAVAFLLPGLPTETVAIALGYGRSVVGTLGKGAGFNAYPLRSTTALNAVPQVTLTKTGKKYAVATTQDHHVVTRKNNVTPWQDPGMDYMQDRVKEIIHEGTLEEFNARSKELVTERKVVLSLFDEHAYDRVYKWGMAVDLTSCTGCSACVIACQAENNIPIVGKEQVLVGREMHWMRIDRFFKGENPDEARAVHQPVMCQHCEMAPCEEVCPVAATTHSHEGLNQMVYNRCIGTRYCSNNCPYKVRRFNFFDYNRGSIRDLEGFIKLPNIIRADMDPVSRMQKNPEVTVRMRGVMEKCTYCVQRIEAARITAKAENNRPIRDGEVTPACAQSCPTQAITFGNLNDPTSRVAKLHEQAHAYGLLDEELHTKPRTQYLARITNPSEDLEGGHGEPAKAKEHGHA